ncbi:MAG TPA: TaqI-like C-terminal specificity domain-containing protein, partial [Bacteroidales bacterium]|nr:TaqI-like C-terminal specificity domain-containing protein [Bacteroidales bacterium]
DHWTNLRNCAYLQEFEKEKIVYPETTLKSSFFLDERNHYIDKTGFILIYKNPKYLISIFNSLFFQWTYKKLFSSVILGENGFQFNKHAFEKYPIPEISESEQQPFVALVEQILAKKEKGEDTTALENQIDQLVYQLYGLTEEEIAIIKNSTK